MIEIYSQWSQIWQEAGQIIGLGVFILFLSLTLSVSFLLFNSIASSMNGSAEAKFQYMFAFICIGYLICLGNSAYYLNNTVSVCCIFGKYRGR